jgi:FixJ family two-component response regulator
MGFNCRVVARSPQLPQLTSLEYDVLTCLVRGEAVKSLSVLVSIPTEVALGARTALMEKLSARSVADLVRIALQAGVR